MGKQKPQLTKMNINAFSENAVMTLAILDKVLWTTGSKVELY